MDEVKQFNPAMLFGQPTMVQPITKNSILISGMINLAAAMDLIRELEVMIDRILESDKPRGAIRVIINTPGGEVEASILMAGFIETINSDDSDIVIDTCIRGQCASAGALLFAVGHERTYSRRSVVLCHDYNFITGGADANTRRIRVGVTDSIIARSDDMYNDHSTFYTDDKVEQYEMGEQLIFQGKDIDDELLVRDFYKSRDVLIAPEPDEDELMSDIKDRLYKLRKLDEDADEKVSGLLEKPKDSKDKPELKVVKDAG